MAEPHILYLELFAACDMTCPMCVTMPYRDGVRTAMSRKMIRERIFEPAIAAGMRRLVISGGEPTLRKDFFAIVGDARQLGFKIWVATNLWRFDEPKLRRLLAAFDGEGHVIAVSYDSVVASEMNAIRDGAVFEAVDRNCRQMLALRAETGSAAKIIASLVVQEENFASVQPTIDHVLEDIGFDQIIVQMRHDYQSVTADNQRAQKRSEWVEKHERELLQTGIDLYARRLKDPRIQAQGDFADWIHFVRDPHAINRPCEANQYLFVNAEGLIRPCMFGRSYASLAAKQLPEIIVSPQFAASRKFVSECRICNLGCN